MNNITKTMLSCEELSGKIANNIHNMGKSLRQMGLIDKIRAEVVLLKDIATEGIRVEFEKKQPNANAIIAQLKSQINDGYKGLSLQLSNDITNF